MLKMEMYFIDLIGKNENRMIFRISIINILYFRLSFKLVKILIFINSVIRCCLFLIVDYYFDNIKKFFFVK